MDVSSENDIYITGISGLFPECDSVRELQQNLFNKVDLMTEDERRWKNIFPKIPKNSGKIRKIDNFDASFFKINYKNAHSLDHMARLLLERVYECIIDSGVNPSELYNTNTAVIVGICIGESENEWFYNKVDKNQYGVMGCARSSIPAYISEWLGVTGPSYIIDTACSSSMYALEHAYKLIRDGLCDAAIVGGANLTLNPLTSLCFASLGVLSVDGKCKTFDEKANGYGRSESIVACFLQRAKDSRRVHAKLIHAKTNCDGYKEQGITYPAGSMQVKLLSQFYEECGIRPSIVEFVETHGTGTQVGDPEELSAVDRVFCPGRDGPLLIGSIKSNLGHSEPSSGLNSIAKLCIAYNTGYIPANINYSTPRRSIAALVEGRLKVVTETTPWNRGLAAVSSFGFGGANAHILLQNVARDKINNGLPSDELPRLVCVSGRTAAAVARVLDDLESRPVDADEVRLWHAIHERDINGHHYRGFTLLRSSEKSHSSTSLTRNVKYFEPVENRPLYLFYTSLGQHWSTVASSLIKIPIFYKALQRCQCALDAVDINLISMLNTAFDAKDSLTNDFSFVGSVAVQIGITDILNAIGIKSKNIIPQNNVLCRAYVEGSLNAEDTILAAYSICAARDVPEMQEILFSLKSCSARLESWFKLHWTKLIAYLAADNIASSSLLDTLSSIPMESIVIHVGIEELFNSVVAMCPENISIIHLLQQDMKDTTHFFTALGRLYEIGLNSSLANVYPEIKFPVPQSTPMLSHLVEWNHNESWFVNKYKSDDLILCNERTIQISIKNEHSEYLSDHVIDGRIIFPGTGYLVCVWETLALLTGRLYFEVSVEFRDVYFRRATPLRKDIPVELTVSLHRGSGCFEVIENGVSIVNGYICEKPNLGEEFRAIPETPRNTDPDYKLLNSKDFYKELYLRGYGHQGLFRGVDSCDVDCSKGFLIWNENWVTFLDLLLQTNLLPYDTRSLMLPTRIEKLSIDVDLHNKIISKLKSKFQNHNIKLEFRRNHYLNVARSGGVEARGAYATSVVKKAPLGIPVYEQSRFIPNFNHQQMKLKDVLRINLQIILENVQAYRFKSIELVDTDYEDGTLEPIIEEVGNILADMPLVQAELIVLSKHKFQFASNITVANKKIMSEPNANLIIGANLINRENICRDALKILRDNGYLLSREKNDHIDFCSKEFQIVTKQRAASEYYILLKKRTEMSEPKCVEVRLDNQKMSWIDEVKRHMNQGEKIVLYSQNEPVNGLLGLVNCLRKETSGENVVGVLIADRSAPTFNPSATFYKEQLDKQLAINIYKDGQWGTYRHLLLDEPNESMLHHAYFKQTVIGDLSSLRWLEGPLSNKPLQKGVKVFVYCSALNFRDVMTALGRVSVEAVARTRFYQDCVQGIEAAGKTINGTRVMLVCQRGISNLVEVEDLMTWPVPDEWTLAEAATVPLAYATVYFALVLMGKMRKGEKILIHAGTGAVGQAAINVALHYGLEVFTTVGTTEKRTFIKRLFPQIPDSHIGNSRDVTFEDMVHRETNGEGVDLVLNSLADDKLQASVKCLRRGGRFLEIGKYDIYQNTQIETCFLERGISFHGVMLDYLNEKSQISLRKNIRDLLLNGILSGAVRPISHCVFEKENAESAFRYMAAGKHVGKIIIKIREEEPKNVTIRPSNIPLKGKPRYICDPDQVYVLVGGLGGFGLELTDWLVLRGARKLLFSSRRGISNGYQSLRLKIWKSYGVKIQICTHDVSSDTGCESMLKLAAAMGPVKAIFNLAVVLKDALFQNQTVDTFQESLKPKAQATIYLDQYSRKICPDLSEFVVFSSVSCGRGNAGQTNYGYSNSIMERVCEERKSLGLPALAIQWGAIGDVGLVADMQENNMQLEIGGTLQQGITSCIEAMDIFLKQDACIVSSIVVAEKKIGGASHDDIVNVVAQIIGIGDIKTLSRQVPLSEMGMDSVMAVEIKQTLERDYELFLSAQEIRMLTFAKLKELSTISKDKKETVPDIIPLNNNVNLDGLQLLISKLGDEETALLPFVNMPTLASNRSEEVAADSNETVLFLLPGLESSAKTFESLCAHLEVKACVLQLGISEASDDFTKITDRLYTTVKERLPEGAPFFLLGYSFGCVPILQLAAKLENEGSRGAVFCLDGSPEYVTALMKTFLDCNNDNQLQITIIANFFNIMQSKISSDNLISKINLNVSFEEKFETAISLSPSKLEYSKQFLLTMAKSAFNRIKLLMDYDETKTNKITSPIILLRQKVIPSTFSCNEMYGLEKYTSGSVSVHFLDGDHSTIVDNAECAKVIHKTITTILDDNGNNVRRRTDRRLGTD